MANTEFTSASAQTRKVWAEFMSRETIEMSALRPLMGRSEDAAIQVHRDLQKGRGDRIKVDLLTKIEGYGKHGSNTLKGNESTLDFHQMELGIDQLREAITYDSMTQQRTIHNLRRLGTLNLRDFYSRVMDETMFAQLVGTAGSNTALSTAMDGFGGNAFTAPDASHIVDGTGAVFTTNLITEAREKAKTIDPRVDPLMVDGEPKYVLYLHPRQVTSLKNATGASNWREITAVAGPRGSRNPVYTGAVGEWDGVILRESEYVVVAGSNVIHAPFLGRQAGHLAFGNPYRNLNRRPSEVRELWSWFEEEDDYGDKTGLAVATIWGIKGAVFNSAFFGRLVIKSTDAAAS